LPGLSWIWLPVHSGVALGDGAWASPDVHWTAMDPVPIQELALQINELRKRVYWLEQALMRHGIALQQEPPRTVAAPAPPSPASAVAELPSSAPMHATSVVIPVPPAISHAVKPAAATHSLENRIGSQWFNRIGILAVLISMAWFLKLAIDNHWIGPVGRVLIGLIAGAALIAWSERFRSRGYAAFSYSLKAVGSGILYLSLWAAYSLFHLIPSSVAFPAMIAVTAFNGFMAWVQDSELLALYAIAGGLTTPLLLSEGGNHEVTLLSYLFMLDIAVLTLVILKPWSRLLFASFLGTILFFTGWWMSFYSDAQGGRTAVFVTIFFLLFAFAPRVIKLRPGAGIGVETGPDPTQPSAWDNLVGIVVPLTNAAMAFLAFYGIVDQSTACWVAVAFAAFYLGMNSLPERGILRRSPPALISLHLATAVVFLTLALPLKAHGRWLTTGWLVEGASLLWVASRAQLLLLRVLAVLCLLLGLMALLAVNPPASLTPILNERFGAYCVAIAAFAFAAWLGARERRREEAGDPLPWLAIAPAALLVVNILILVALGWEIHNYWWYLRWHGNSELFHDWEMYAHFSYSGLFMLFGAILLSVGFWKRSAFVRWQALVLLAVAIGKVFLVDMSELSQGYRILSFLGLGVLLLGVSYVYQRDWLNLRKPAPEATPEPTPNPGSNTP
jgi:uncharacterized membrane protein